MNDRKCALPACPACPAGLLPSLLHPSPWEPAPACTPVTSLLSLLLSLSPPLYDFPCSSPPPPSRATLPGIQAPSSKWVGDRTLAHGSTHGAAFLATFGRLNQVVAWDNGRRTVDLVTCLPSPTAEPRGCVLLLLASQSHFPVPSGPYFGQQLSVLWPSRQRCTGALALEAPLLCVRCLSGAVSCRRAGTASLFGRGTGSLAWILVLVFCGQPQRPACLLPRALAGCWASGLGKAYLHPQETA